MTEPSLEDMSAADVQSPEQLRETTAEAIRTTIKYVLRDNVDLPKPVAAAIGILSGRALMAAEAQAELQTLQELVKQLHLESPLRGQMAKDIVRQIKEARMQAYQHALRLIRHDHADSYAAQKIGEAIDELEYAGGDG